MNPKELQPIKQRYGIVGNSDGLNRALDIAIQVAPTDLSVIIEGENGVGKEALPRIIHDHSTRKHQKYFAINCGSIPEGTIDSELFGHEKGSFTGAVGEHEGYFGAANKGTLFLDEVGELPLSTQVRLLRVLETGEYLRVGSNEVRKTDVRIIAATNVKMKKAISEGRFREDLYYRLATIPITMPPLRERGSDIEVLFRKFAADVAERYRLDPIYLADDAKQLLRAYKWPGNIRQLKNLTEQLSIISREREITAATLQEFGITDDSATTGGLVLARDIKNGNNGMHSYEQERDMLLQQLFNLGQEIKELKAMVQQSAIQQTPASSPTILSPSQSWPMAKSEPLPAKTSVSEADHSLHYDDIETAEAYVEEAPRSIKEQNEQSILEALKRNNYNRKRAAAELGISERTIYRKLKDMGVKLLAIILLLSATLLPTACSISYSFNGSSIDYTKVHSVSIDKFPIRSAYVWAPMESMFYNSLSDAFANKTKLQVLKRNGDLQLAGEITEYAQLNKSVSSDGFSAQTQLKVTVNVRFVNNSKHDEDFEKQFSATAEYDSSQQLSAVQEELVQQIIDDIVDQIFNATVANW